MRKNAKYCRPTGWIRENGKSNVKVYYTVIPKCMTFRVLHGRPSAPPYLGLGPSDERGSIRMQFSRQTVASFYRHKSSSGATGQAINRRLPFFPSFWPEDLERPARRCNIFPVWIHLSPPDQNLAVQSFPDIIIWYWLHLDFSNFETVLPFKVTYDIIWYDMSIHGS